MNFKKMFLYMGYCLEGYIWTTEAARVKSIPSSRAVDSTVDSVRGRPGNEANLSLHSLYKQS